MNSVRSMSSPLHRRSSFRAFGNPARRPALIPVSSLPVVKKSRTPNTSYISHHRNAPFLRQKSINLDDFKYQ